MKKEDLNIRALYEDILNKYAEANGVVILENVKIPTNNSSPDKVNFDGETFHYDENGGQTFCFIGQGADLLAYGEDSGTTHPTVFNTISKLSAALGFTEFPPSMSYLKYKYDNFKPSHVNKFLDEFGVGYFGNLTKENLTYFDENQLSGAMGDTRINTKSGRLWNKTFSKSANKEVTPIMFWCREKDLTEDHLKSLKKSFGLGDILWAATDSANFNAYTDDYRESESGEIKELKSKIFKDLTHEDIVSILMRAHSDQQLSPSEKKVVWEFRGHDPSEIQHITGGYPSKAEFNYRQRFSESKED
jgi:hypothetical protein